MTQNLRQVHALVLQAGMPTANLRQVHALTLSAAALGIAAGKSAADALKASIMATASTVGKPVVASDFTLGNPVASTGARNTTVKATTAVPGNVSGEQTFSYDRRTLASTASLFTAAVEIGTGNTSVLAKLAAINAITGIVFEARDLVDTAIPDKSTQVVLEAATTSFAFIPGTKLTVAVHSSTPVPPALSVAAPNTNLAGFDAEG